MERNLRFMAVFALAILLYAAAPARADDERSLKRLPEKRVALVIGNSAYLHTTVLPNPKNDAEKIAAALRRLGFEVDAKTDLNRLNVEKALRQFGDRLPGSKAAVFFYAGHGIQVDGYNYIVPIDAKLEKERDLNYEVIRVDTVLKEMEAEQRINVVFLDACRDNPLAVNLVRSMGKSRSSNVGRGLAPINAAAGTLISYATKDGSVAADGTEANSPFTTAILKHIEEEGLEVGMLIRRVREEVMSLTDKKQIPWEYGSLLGEFYFKPARLAEPAIAAPKPGDAAPLRTDDMAVEMRFWESVEKRGKAEDYKAYLEAFPKGRFSALAKVRLQDGQSPQSAAAKPPTETTIAAMEAGQKGWTSADAMYADKNGELWLKPDRKVYFEPNGKAIVLVLRGKDGYAVDISKTKAKWPKKGDADKKDISVANVTYWDSGSSSASSQSSSSGRFSKDGQGIIKDKQTDLQWYVGPDSDMTWYQAQSWVQSLSVGGGRWRMPTRAELSGLNGSGETPSPKGNYNYDIDPIFNLRACCPWSGEVRDSSSAWNFDFFSGKELWLSREDGTTTRAFAVRTSLQKVQIQQEYNFWSQ